MISAMFMYAGSDVLAKLLTKDFHPVQVIWFRQFALYIGLVVILAMHGLRVFRSGRPGLQISRGALAASSSLLFVFAVQHVPLADAVAATFAAPFFLTILAALVLKEKVGVRRWSAVFVGFIGALIIIRPGGESIHPAVMLVVIAAAFYAIRQVLSRILADTDKTLTTIAYTAIVGLIMISLVLPFFWQTPTTRFQWLAFLAMALFAGAGEVLVIRSLEITEAVTVAPIHYTLLIWGTLYGYLVFGQLPDQWTWVGTAIIVAAGLYTLQRDKLKTR